MRETFGILIMCRKHKEVFMNQIDRFLVVLCLLPDIIFNKIKLITVPVVGYYLNTIILALLSIYLSSFIENITFAYLKYNSAYSVTVLLSISFFINCILQVLYTLYLRWRNYFIYSSYSPCNIVLLPHALLGHFVATRSFRASGANWIYWFRGEWDINEKKGNSNE